MSEHDYCKVWLQTHCPMTQINLWSTDRGEKEDELTLLMGQTERWKQQYNEELKFSSLKVTETLSMDKSLDHIQHCYANYI